MWVKRELIAAALTFALCGAARAESCGPRTLGVSRTIAVGAPAHLGLKTYPQTLDLKDHEVVLTFDDGPAPTTRRVLEALEAQCARATFFLIGRNAAAMPQIVRREIADGDTVGSHSNTHSMLRSLPFDKATADIDAGAAAVDKASSGNASKFFRFPGFADSPALLAALDQRKMPVFGADLWASDWNVMTPKEELELLMGRLRRAKSGIVLLHDTKKQTAEMLPAFLAELKAEGFQLVQIVPGDAPPSQKQAPAGWKSETEATLKKMGIRGPKTASPKVGLPLQEQKDPAPRM
ncbi:polysaccharide deacetylase family protein [Rhodoblastus acidophilus]|uniref:Chitooligosaccharide deacetylase n=1 Tax=Candidatus Rhodoblastus alkanivorans TaxID=2954117 RepID=A0ABS9Z636_9HYPH|nr:polysaccharide deacetylase family protein [Candidatus Rhodoblastus alkanivorans]MCI4680274.1 polysaccharide deacetylase family protein [Candidatus Rhodoblastus alkanivorans]MCI4683093.1 polysaccharide deacetylase family protein [Candidatus Rhodoblastus alkanivorans]MDI4640404.1 polysaccharide deacetylase family protein [Rhodoblastus acidophilus]